MISDAGYVDFSKPYLADASSNGRTRSDNEQ